MKTKSIVLCLVAAFCLLFPVMGFAQEAADVAADTTQVLEETTITTAEESNTGEIIKTVLLAILFLGLSGAMIAHMVYVKFFKKPLQEDYTVDYFKELRSQGEYPSEEEANDKAAELMSNIYNSWTPIDQEGETKVPYSRSDVNNALAAVEEAVKLAPTDEDVVAAINELSRALNECCKRTFGGSKTFLIVSLIIGLVLSFISGTWGFMGMIVVSSVIYWFASQTPIWMQIRTELKGNGGKASFMTRLLGGLFGAAATAETYKVVTTYSDGSKTEETDNSNFWFTLIFSIVVMVVLAVCMFFVAVINYLRNYVIYR